jgi:hypothetical protein
MGYHFWPKPSTNSQGARGASLKRLVQHFSHCFVAGNTVGTFRRLAWRVLDYQADDWTFADTQREGG